MSISMSVRARKVRVSDKLNLTIVYLTLLKHTVFVLTDHEPLDMAPCTSYVHAMVTCP